MQDDPCDEWPVTTLDGRLYRFAREDRTWIIGGPGEIINWRRIDEDGNGDTVYRCIVLYALEAA